MAGKSSAELLSGLFSRFQRRAKADTGVKVSMRKVSEELLSSAAPHAPLEQADGARARRKPDANALGRWTNPGGRRNWFLPLGRVVEVAERLQASPAERDELMLARLHELAAAEPGHDVLTCGAWVAGRIIEQSRLDEDEEAVLAAFRRARAVSPYAMMSSDRTARLEAFFAGLAREHLADLALDHAAEEGADAHELDTANLRQRALAAVQSASTMPLKCEQVSAEVVARRFLRRLKRGSA